MVEVRLANTNDAKDIVEIYAPIVQTTATSFETEVPSVTEMQTRIEACLQKYPWIVCLIDRKVTGYVYASKHREREAYQWTCECSVYIHDDYKGQGIGQELYKVLFRVLKLQEFRSVYAGIALPNDASVRLHEKCGFQYFTRYENIGFKFGNWHSVGWWKLQINDYDLQPPPPLKIAELNPGLLTELFTQTAQKIQSRFTD